MEKTGIDLLFNRFARKSKSGFFAASAAAQPLQTGKAAPPWPPAKNGRSTPAFNFQTRV